LLRIGDFALVHKMSHHHSHPADLPEGFVLPAFVPGSTTATAGSRVVGSRVDMAHATTSIHTTQAGLVNVGFDRVEVQIPVMRPVEVREKIVEVPVIQTVEKLVPKIEIREVIKRIPKIEQKLVEKLVEVPQIKLVDKFVSVDQIHEVVKHIPKIRIQEVIREVPKMEIHTITKPVEVPVVQFKNGGFGIGTHNPILEREVELRENGNGGVEYEYVEIAVPVCIGQITKCVPRPWCKGKNPPATQIPVDMLTLSDHHQNLLNEYVMSLPAFNAFRTPKPSGTPREIAVATKMNLPPNSFALDPFTYPPTGGILLLPPGVAAPPGVIPLPANVAGTPVAA